MLPSELKLTSLKHCYVHLPETFVSREPAIKGGAIVSIKSIQNDHELFVMWDGQLTAGEHVELDLDFAQANSLKTELVIISSVDNLKLTDCSFCHAELINSSDYTILSQHTDLNVLDTCKLICRGLVVPIYISQHVKVSVKILTFEPNQPFGLLTKWTEMSFQDNSDTKRPTESTDKSSQDIVQIVDHPTPFLSCALSDQYKAKFPLYSILVCGNSGSGKTNILEKIISNCKHYYGNFTNCKQFRGKRPESVKKILGEIAAQAIKNQPSIIALDDIDSFSDCDLKQEGEQGQEVMYKKRLVDIFCQLIKQLERQDSAKIILIASCRSLESVDKQISAPKGREYFNSVIKLEPPSLAERVEIIKELIKERQQIRSSLDERQFIEFAQRCNSFMPSDLRRLFERALLSACSRSINGFDSNPVTLELADFMSSLDGYVPKNLRSLPPQVKTSRTFADVGGMDKIKDIIKKTVLLPIRYPKLYKRCPLRPQNSILLYGPPGCGKTLIAEALTNQEGLNSICVRGPELLSKYIGASEAAVRDLFKRAHLARPCVIFFDEFESLVAKRGADSTGVTDRVVNQFLTILDGVEILSHDVFIVAATSRPDMIDPAMLRPGRLDKHIYCPLPVQQDRHKIIKILSRDMCLDENVDLSVWSEKLHGFSGADLQAFLFSAQLKSLRETIGTASDQTHGKVRHTTEIDKVKDFDIVVSERHLMCSYEEMKAGIDAKLNFLLVRYPATIGQAQMQRVAMRATLA